MVPKNINKKNLLIKSKIGPIKNLLYNILIGYFPRYKLYVYSCCEPGGFIFKM